VEAIGSLLNSVSGLALGLVILGAGIWLGLRRLRNIESRKEQIPEA